MKGLFLSGTVLGALLLGAVAHAQLGYTVSDGADTGHLKIQLSFKANSDKTQVQMPNWGPGSYRLTQGWQRLTDLSVMVGSSKVDAARSEVGTLPKIVTWTIPAKKGDMVTVSYQIPTQFNNGVGHYGGPATYMYPVGRTQEPCTLQYAFAKPTNVAIGLDPVKENTLYKVDTYDHLADNPVTYGDYKFDVYMQYGKPHYIVYRGPENAINEVDREYVKKACQFVTTMEGDFFGGGVPYNRYVWHFAVNSAPDGAGGLEHLSSTEISMGSGVGPGVVGVYAHEFFHLWNVKRIRSKVLGPFDYTVLPQTGALWWLEGVTDYYAHTLLGRYGWYGKNERQPDPITKMYATMVQNVNTVRNNKERFNISPHDASFRVKEAANGVGNSNGLLVSYYDTGWLCGLCLDIEILAQTNGKKSLDDVEHELFDECKNNKPGFEESEIRNLLVKHGGPKLGEMYDTIIMKPGELPVEAQLAKIGLEMKDIEETYGKAPFIMSPSPDDKAMKIASSDIDSLKIGDLVTKVNTFDFNSDQVRTLNGAYRNLTRANKPGEKWMMTVVSGGQTRTVTVELVTGTRKSRKVVDLPSVTPEQKKLRALFESKKR